MTRRQYQKKLESKRIEVDEVDETRKWETQGTDKMKGEEKNYIGQKRRQDEEQKIRLEADDKKIAKSERRRDEQ